MFSEPVLFWRHLFILYFKMSDKEKNIKNVALIAFGFLILFLIFGKSYLIYASLFLLLISILSETLSQKISRIWMKISQLLGMIVSKTMLFLVFFLILTPLALAYRIFNRNPLLIKKTSQKSYYIQREHLYSPSDFENIW